MRKSGPTPIRIAWQPQPGPQKALIDCPVYEIFYGGARGGGKTDGSLGKMGLKALRYGAAFNGVHFRHEMPQSDDVIERSKEIFEPIGAKYQEQQRQWRFPGGGRLRFRPLENIKDSEKYQGQNLSDAVVEEAGNYADPAPIRRLHACLRSTKGVPVQILLTGNPGGPGQHWIKRRYIDPAPQGMQILKETIEFGGVIPRLELRRTQLDGLAALLSGKPVEETAGGQSPTTSSTTRPSRSLSTFFVPDRPASHGSNASSRPSWPTSSTSVNPIRWPVTTTS